MKKGPFIAVLGGGNCSTEMTEKARQVGCEIGRRDGILICGGLGGVMHAACRGASEAGGLTIGIMPGISRNDANPYVDIPIITGMADARNVIIIRSAHAAIAIDGEFGTLSEIAFALKFQIPVIGIDTWNVDPRVHVAESPKDAVSMAFRLAGQNLQ